MKPWAVFGIVIAIVAALAGIGYSYSATYSAGDGNGYNRRVGEESKAFSAAEDRGRRDQVKADADRVAQLQQALDDANAAVATRQKNVDDLNRQNQDLSRRLEDARKQSADARRWLSEPIPAAVLCRLQRPPTCTGTGSGDPRP